MTTVNLSQLNRSRRRERRRQTSNRWKIKQSFPPSSVGPGHGPRQLSTELSPRSQPPQTRPTKWTQKCTPDGLYQIFIPGIDSVVLCVVDGRRGKKCFNIFTLAVNGKLIDCVHNFPPHQPLFLPPSHHSRSESKVARVTNASHAACVSLRSSINFPVREEERENQI